MRPILGAQAAGGKVRGSSKAGGAGDDGYLLFVIVERLVPLWIGGHGGCGFRGSSEGVGGVRGAS